MANSKDFLILLFPPHKVQLSVNVFRGFNFTFSYSGLLLMLVTIFLLRDKIFIPHDMTIHVFCFFRTKKNVFCFPYFSILTPKLIMFIEGFHFIHIFVKLLHYFIPFFQFQDSCLKEQSGFMFAMLVDILRA